VNDTFLKKKTVASDLLSRMVHRHLKYSVVSKIQGRERAGAYKLNNAQTKQQKNNITPQLIKTAENIKTLKYHGGSGVTDLWLEISWVVIRFIDR
jgi:hypothetical protein